MKDVNILRVASVLIAIYSSIQTVHAATCEYSFEEITNSRARASLTIRNSGEETINYWDVSWEYRGSDRIIRFLDGDISGINPYKVTSNRNTAHIEPGELVTYSFIVNKTEELDFEIPKINGDICTHLSLSGVTASFEDIQLVL